MASDKYFFPELRITMLTDSKNYRALSVVSQTKDHRAIRLCHRLLLPLSSPRKRKSKWRSTIAAFAVNFFVGL
jgi:hypothetical protein